MVNEQGSSTMPVTLRKGNFRVSFRLCFKVSPSAKPFIWKSVLFTCKLRFIVSRDGCWRVSDVVVVVVVVVVVATAAAALILLFPHL